MRVLGATGLLAMGLALACATPPSAPVAPGGPSASEEAPLREAAAEYDAWIERHSLSFEDEALNAYVGGVAQRVLVALGAPADDAIRVRVVRNPLMNAAAFPNGVVHLHTGILARIENEAQLATLLGHELTHYTHRHTLAELRNAQRKRKTRSAMNTLAMLLAITGNPAALAVSGLTAVSADRVFKSQLEGYSQDLELAADRAGFEAVAKAGYDPRESVRFFELVLLDEELPTVEDPYFYASHPAMNERIAHYRKLLAKTQLAETPEIGAERYQAAVAEVLVANARYDLASGRLRSAKLALDRRVRSAPPSAEAHYLLGEWQRTQAGAAAKAAQAYRAAVALDGNHAQAWRALGLAERELGNAAAAGEALAKALELAPDLSDRKILEVYQRELASQESR